MKTLYQNLCNIVKAPVGAKFITLIAYDIKRERLKADKAKEAT